MTDEKVPTFEELEQSLTNARGREREPRRQVVDDNEVMTAEQIAEYERHLEAERAANEKLRLHQESIEEARKIARLTNNIIERDRVAAEDAPPSVPRVVFSGRDEK
jgi:hypothetical protein